MAFVSVLLLVAACGSRQNARPVNQASLDKTEYYKIAAHQCDKLKPDPVATDKSIICFYAEITKDTIAKLLSVQIPVNAVLVVDSPGGDVEAALIAANVIFDKKVDLVINRWCMSSCANYFFPAARYKFVMPDSWIGWHGGPARDISWFSQDPKVQAENHLLMIKQDDFFKKISVDETVIYEHPDPNSIDMKKFKAGRLFWVWPPDQLEKRFGIKGILSSYPPFVSYTPYTPYAPYLHGSK